MAKEGAKRRIIKPDFKPQISMPDTSSALREIANREHLVLLDSIGRREGKRKKPEELAAQSIIGKRKRVSKINTSEFYLHLFHALKAGEISRQNEASLFSDREIQVCSIPGFSPDLVISGGLRDTYVEVKSASFRSAKPWFSHRQFLGYTTALLENKGSEMITAIFRYGEWEGNYLYKYDGGGLADALSKTTRELLILPHNFLTFFLILCHSEDMSHVSSTGRASENYKRPYGRWLTMLRKHYKNPDEAIDIILEDARSKHLGLMDFSRENFYLHGLKTEQYDSPEIYCRNRRIGNWIADKQRKNTREKWKPFVVTEYKLGYNDNSKKPYNDEWVDYFRNNLEAFIENLDMTKDYRKLQAWIEKAAEPQRERVAIQNESELRMPKKPDDGIPI